MSDWVLFHVPWWHPLCLWDALGLQRPLKTQNKSHSTTMGTNGTARKWETLVSPVWCSPGDVLFIEILKSMEQTAGKLLTTACPGKAVPVVEQRQPLNFDDFSTYPYEQKHRLWHPQRRFLFFGGGIPTKAPLCKWCINRELLQHLSGHHTQAPFRAAVWWARWDTHRVASSLWHVPADWLLVLSLSYCAEVLAFLF